MLGRRLRLLRKERGLTQEELSDQLKLARTTYAGYEQGKREPDNITLDKIADYFEVSTDYLLGRSEDRTKTDYISDSIPENVFYSVIKETEKEYGVNLQDDPEVKEAFRVLVQSLARMKKKQN